MSLSYETYSLTIIVLPNNRLSKAGTESEMTEIFTGDILRLVGNKRVKRQMKHQKIQIEGLVLMWWTSPGM